MLEGLNEAPQVSRPPTSDPQAKPPARLVLDGYLRREELAQQFGLSPRTIDRWEAQRKGPPRVHVGRTILYHVDSVRQWMRSTEKQRIPLSSRTRSVGPRTHQRDYE